MKIVLLMIVGIFILYAIVPEKYHKNYQMEHDTKKILKILKQQTSDGI